MRTPVASLFVSLAACVANPGPEDRGGGGGGKADDPNPACTAFYVDWLETVYKPALTAQTIDAGRLTQLETLAQDAPCGTEVLGSAAFTSWVDLGNEVVFAPYADQHAAALDRYRADGEDRTRYPTLLEDTAVTEETQLATTAVLAVRPRLNAGAEDLDYWLASYVAHLAMVLTPVVDQSIEVAIENPWILNPGEAQFLDLVARTRPTTVRDGAFGAWVKAYDQLLWSGSQAMDPEDDHQRPGCLAWEGTPLEGTIPTITEPCQRASVLARIEALKPQARGEIDAEEWMRALYKWATQTATSGPDTVVLDAEQLARIDAVRPFTRRGAGAYKLWLETIAGSASNLTIVEDSVMPAEPCIGPEGDEIYVAFLTEHLSTLPASVTSRAAPNACP